KLSENNQSFVMISSVIHANVHHIFPGMTINGCYQFRVTRNSDMWVDEDEIENLMVAIKGELHGRNYGAAVRLEVADNCPDHITDFLLRKQGLTQQELYQVNGPVNLHRLGELVSLSNRSDLDYPKFYPGLPEDLERGTRFFEQLQKSDILLHHPYQSFEPVVWFLQDAATDPNVLAIKMTLYRVGADSPIVHALIAAAKANKDVTAIVELRARFDEAANIRLATRLVEAGAKVAYGVVNHKCHAKLMLIVRREGPSLKRYIHVGTGNYHIRNAKLYTDYSLISSDPLLGEDIHHLFMQLTGLGTPPDFNAVLHAPFTLQQQLIQLIDTEREAALAGKPASIIAKINALTEAKVIQALYKASMAGVQIRLIIRGICSLRPQKPVVSENIHVCSVVGRMLEHTRVYAFHNNGQEKVYIASADWMDRNLLRRVEAATPVTQSELKKRILEDLELYWSDNNLAWDMLADGTYIQRKPSGNNVNAQKRLCQRLGLVVKE
ncbi:MAG: polyphosphate kinase 1, partial [Myxococcota bacterium]|nr:polyphosphate kinase 1 [Myxococcota bacterium]